MAGSGKTTIGLLVAHALGCAFLDADDLQSAEAVATLSSGEPLQDVERGRWLERVHQTVLAVVDGGGGFVLAFPGLLESDRAIVFRGWSPALTVFLAGSLDILRERVRTREHRFFFPDLISFEFHRLEEPKGVLSLDARRPPDELTAEILRAIRGPPEHGVGPTPQPDELKRANPQP